MKLEFNKQELSNICKRDDDSVVKHSELSVLASDLNVNTMGMIGFNVGIEEDRLGHGLDIGLLRNSLTTFKVNGIDVSDNAEGVIVSASRWNGGRDFFDQTQNFDVLLLQNIYLVTRGDGQIVPNPLNIGGIDCFNSPKCTHVKDWPEKAESLGVKMIFTHSFGVSLDIEYFQNFGNYHVLRSDNGGDQVGLAVHRNYLLPH